VEQLKEQLKYETELLRLVWITAVAVGGSAVGLWLGEMTLLRAGLSGLGMLFTLALVSVGIRQDRTIRRLLRELREER
jgi:hypothetical protein